MQTITLRDFYGKITGYVEIDDRGNKTLRDFYGKILGTYDKRYDVTRDFYGRIVGNGDILTSLLTK